MQIRSDYTSENKPVFSNDLESQLRELETDEQILEYKKDREYYKNAKYRPVYHFVRPSGSLNDPNGFCYWNGKWHLFYQAQGGRIHWGHAVSEDLIHWTDLPFAIYPDVEDHAFSGGTCVDKENNRVIAAYYGFTGYDPENGFRCGTVIATSSDPLLLNWTKVKGGEPVIKDADAPGWAPYKSAPFKDQKPYKVFDSFIWKEDGVYYLITGGHEPNEVTGRRYREMYLFKCENDNLEDWEYVKRFLDHDIFKEMHDDGACPYFMPIEDKYLLLHFSHRCVPKYLIGEYNKDTNDFYPFVAGRFTSGYKQMIAPSAYPCQDGSGHVNCIFNLPEHYQGLDGWYGIMTMVRRFSLGGEWKDELYTRPAADYSVLHDKHHEESNLKLKLGERTLLPDCEGNAFEMDIHIKAESIPDDLAIDVLADKEGEEKTTVAFFKRGGSQYAIQPFADDSMIMVDALSSSISPNVMRHPPETALVPKQDDEDLRIRIFADKSIVEVFVNEKVCLTKRCYPSKDDSIHVYLTSRRQDAVVDKIDFWTMKSIY